MLMKYLLYNKYALQFRIKSFPEKIFDRNFIRFHNYNLGKIKGLHL